MPGTNHGYIILLPNKSLMCHSTECVTEEVCCMSLKWGRYELQFLKIYGYMTVKPPLEMVNFAVMGKHHLRSMFYIVLVVWKIS